MTKRSSLPAALLVPALALPLSACISFGAKPPPSMLTLAPAAALAPDTTQSVAQSHTITIAQLGYPQELATTRVPVHTGATDVAYIKDAQWVELPSRMFARLLVDTVTAKTGRVVLGYRQSLANPGARLGGDVRAFGIEAGGTGGGQAVVAFEATLIRSDDASYEKRRFEARVPVASIDPASAGVALNEAANKVAADIAAWVGP
ncbi:ABC-type transport auxiliary lipoprotein family protein [Sphingomonas sp.]|uniref:ABC-type transport auxiliary lipoprotein family protein n=1 Tax=Sphingomonas sp. TaxID=28214 RepID=UPI001B025AFE|nr:ABC-type transport auxiliary lipoprotein family protein [Sphingomonas sp.]MBO9715227.1 membrane integrity-associated transporter subunit PqiC [Sphingomonas sp.]